MSAYPSQRGDVNTDPTPLLTSILVEASLAPGDQFSPAAEQMGDVLVATVAENMLSELEGILALSQLGDEIAVRDQLYELARHWDNLDWFHDHLRSQSVLTSTQRRRRTLGCGFVRLRDSLVALEAAEETGDKGATGVCRQILHTSLRQLLRTYSSLHRSPGRSWRLAQRHKK